MAPKNSFENKVATLKSKALDLNPNAKILAVTKYYAMAQIQQLYDQGFRAFGENRLQHAIPLIETAPFKAAWHFIGPIQSNKVKKIVQYFDVIQSVSSASLYEKIVQTAEKNQKKISVFLQVNFTGEDQKFGMSKDELEDLIDTRTPSDYVTIKGLMAMGPLTQDTQKIRDCYQQVQLVFSSIQSKVPHLTELSMGMTNDYQIALECGASMVRIGRYFFEEELNNV